MPEPVASLAVTTLNCADPESLAEFWLGLLGGTVIYRGDVVVVISTPRGPLAFGKADDYQPPTWPEGDRAAQVHLDLSAADRDAARAEAIRLGATRAEHQPGGDTWEVLLDPAGHPFCLTSMPPGWPPPFEPSTAD
ncbi:MAG TPA: VOC family protein [Pseudonocardiaceae bacterium]|jgi:hypothetical protein